jgi:hypothetical protein
MSGDSISREARRAGIKADTRKASNGESVVAPCLASSGRGL